MSVFMIALLVVGLVFFGARIKQTMSKSLDIVDNVLDKADKALDVTDVYIDAWASDAKDAAEISSAKRKYQLQDELAKLNKELVDNCKKAITLPTKK